MNLFRTKSVEQTLAETATGDRKLVRNLGAWDLAVMGVAVAVGAGIFSVGAQAIAFHAGPAAIISFLIAGIICAAAVMCYAEFASMIPAAGSAYTFTYTTVGELMAWVIGWDLILEMLMASSVIAKYWSVYLNDFLHLIGFNSSTEINFGWFTFDWAPLIVVAFFTVLLVFGTKIGARVDGAFTILKIGIVVFVVIVGFFYIKPSNYVPFIPPSQPASSVPGAASNGIMTQPLFQWIIGQQPTIYGISGIISGAALVFFAFIGFDAVATVSEETKDPARNVPLGLGLGMVLVIVMYVLVTVVTTGMVSYKDLAKAKDPSLATGFELVGATWAAKIISFAIVLGLTTVVMVMLLSLTRVVFAMSRDGLLPRGLSKVGKHGTPAKLQIAASVLVAFVASCFNINVLSDMINIGTLSAFTLVAISVPIMRKKRPDLHRSFKIPGNPWIPILIAIANLWLMLNLSVLTWIRFVVWLLIGFCIYFGYSYKHSRLGNGELDADLNKVKAARAEQAKVEKTVAGEAGTAKAETAKAEPGE
ncbi:amino acid permease [Bifidobacterium sp. ESL0775]|uniref:amino acid permease n=1 Tax=Bifidobacterium sp. ESL0775 TaxID=2983230 RepID=UPI0023F63056|nr:amino acid permease [Bifidobacterium sp. ESL0775]WEV69034.1 amino acid permease [Bifidobacterium sp. ESL0775]